METAGIAGIRGTHTCRHLFPCQHQPPLCQIGVDGRAGLLPEQPHHIEFADVEGICQSVDIDFLGDMCFQIPQKLGDSSVLRGCRIRKGAVIVLHTPPNLHQEPQQLCAAGNFPAKGFSAQLPLQLLCEVEELPAQRFLRAQNMAVFPGEER